MDSIFGRVKNIVTKSMHAVPDAGSVENLEKVMDQLIADPESEIPIEEKEFYKPKSNLKVYSHNSAQLRGFYRSILGQTVRIAENKLEDLPTDDPYVDHVLAEFWKHEPLLAGAVYSMASKMSTLSWSAIGRKEIVMPFADMLDMSVSMGGRGWGDFLSATSQDYYSTNRGSFWNTTRSGSHLTGKLEELSVVDSLCCALTGNPRKPVFYSSIVTGQDIWWRQGEVTNFSSMTSPREYLLGSGLCAVFRAYKSARILLGLSKYDWEKLNNLPPEGVAPVSGLSQDEFYDSLELWHAAREKNKSLTYPQVLWLLGSNPNSQINVDFVSFSQMPESFNRKDVIDQYVNTLALVFGVDAREFWPISSGSLGTASETEVQHMKAKGKGPGEFMSAIERWLNGELPQNGGEFSFDTQDVGEDQIAASIAKGWVDAFMPLYSPGSGTAPSKSPTAPAVDSPEGGASQSNLEQGTAQGAEPLITKDQFLRLLVDRRVLPNWVINDDKVMRTDIGVTEKELENVSPDDNICITYKHGKFFYTRPVITMSTTEKDLTDPITGTLFGAPYAELKEERESNIRGKAISPTESLRGPRITKSTVKAEMDLWLSTPELAAYVPNPDEHEYTQVLYNTEASS